MHDYKMVRQGQIDGVFTGFDDEALFKLLDGTYWLQAEYKYWYHYAYCPVVGILQAGDALYIRVDGQDEIVAVRQIYGVTQSKIRGAFKGWAGDTTYELDNGQVWQQSTYKYEYKYAYRPEAIVYAASSGYRMSVAGTLAKVKRLR